MVLIEDDAPVMRLMSWALTGDGFDVQIVSRRAALEARGFEPPDVAVFNMKASAPGKTQYFRQLRMLNPAVIIIDVDEQVVLGSSTRDSGADSYTERPVTLDAVSTIIRLMTDKTLEERQSLRDEREGELRPGVERTTDAD